MNLKSLFTSMVLVKFLGITDRRSMRNFIIWIISMYVFLGIIEYNLGKSTEKSYSLEGAYEECYKTEYRKRIAIQKIISKFPIQNIAAGEKVVNVMCKEKKGIQRFSFIPFNYKSPDRVYGYYQIFTPAGTEGRISNFDALLEEKIFASILVKD